jgi:hypothetical protein
MMRRQQQQQQLVHSLKLDATSTASVVRFTRVVLVLYLWLPVRHSPARIVSRSRLPSVSSFKGLRFLGDVRSLEYRATLGAEAASELASDKSISTFPKVRVRV